MCYLPFTVLSCFWRGFVEFCGRTGFWCFSLLTKWEGSTVGAIIEGVGLLQMALNLSKFYVRKHKLQNPITRLISNIFQPNLKSSVTYSRHSPKPEFKLNRVKLCGRISSDPLSNKIHTDQTASARLTWKVSSPKALFMITWHDNIIIAYMHDTRLPQTVWHLVASSSSTQSS